MSEALITVSIACHNILPREQDSFSCFIYGLMFQ
jgi:hypothetical protein